METTTPPNVLLALHLPFQQMVGVASSAFSLLATAENKAFLEATTGFEPVVRVLQTLALPLGHVAYRRGIIPIIRLGEFTPLNLRKPDLKNPVF